MLFRRALLLAPAVSILQGQDARPNMFADAEAYEQFMGRWSRLLARPFAEFTGLPERGRMLDAGSGTGSLAFTIAERIASARVLGIDPSKEYVAYAGSRNAFAGESTSGWAMRSSCNCRTPASMPPSRCLYSISFRMRTRRCWNSAA